MQHQPRPVAPRRIYLIQVITEELALVPIEKTSYPGELALVRVDEPLEIPQMRRVHSSLRVVARQRPPQAEVRC
jgi:hypothetical protein